MRVGVASVMHSGTHLIYKMLTSCLKCKGVSIEASRAGEHGVFLFHLVDAHRDALDMRHLVTPMRHPVRIAESFRRRGKPIEDMYRQFENLARIDPIFIHVDRVDRDAYVARAGKELGVQLHTDWPLLSPKNTLGYKVTPARIKSIPAFIMDIYDKSIYKEAA